MTKAQIKAELRRSAMCDDSPYWEVDGGWSWSALGVWGVADDYAGEAPWSFAPVDVARTFFLLVAEAL